MTIKTDHSDHLYQIRTCERLKETIDFYSAISMKMYKTDPKIIAAMGNIYEKNENLQQLYKKEEFVFENLEYIYEELLIRGLLDLLRQQDSKLLTLTYHLYMYARYFSNEVSIASIMQPFVHRILKKLKKYESQTSKKRVKHKKRLLIFSASQKIMIGMHKILFEVTHEKVYELVKHYIQK